MNSKKIEKKESGYSTYIYIHLFFVFIGLISYLMFLFLLCIYIKDISFLKNELFSFIILNSFKSFLEIMLSSSFIKEIIIYIFEIIEFYLILSFINKSLCSKKISSNYELEYLYYILFIYILCFFPYENTFNLKGKMVFTHNTIKISLIILLFRYIQIKMDILLDYLKEKKMIVTSRPDIYMPYKKAQYYYTNFTIINILYYIILILAVTYYVLKILILFVIERNKIIKYLILIFEESIYCTLIVSCFIFFYTLNRSKFRKRRKKKDKSKVEENLPKFTESDIDNQHDETTQLSENNKDKKENNVEKNEENIDEEENVKSNGENNK